MGSSNWNEADHPRVPGGDINGGQFTEKGMATAAKAAVDGAALDKQYTLRFGYGDRNEFTVYKVPGGGTLSLAASRTMRTGEGIPVIYNAETNTWHIAPQTEHGDFSREARERVEKTFAEEVIARGYMRTGMGGWIEMYDHTQMLPEILGGRWDKERMLVHGIERVRRLAEQNVFSFYDTKDRLVTPDIDWVE